MAKERKQIPPAQPYEYSPRVHPEAQRGLTPAWTPLRYHPTQHALWYCDKRFAIVAAGRGSGKTELAKRRLVRYLPVAKPWPDPKYFYGAPTQLQAKRIAWTHLLQLIPDAWIANVVVSELRVQTVFGSELWVVGLDEPQRIEGTQWDGCVLDECADIKPGTFRLSVRPALTWRKGWCWRIGVPKRYGIGAAEFRRDFLAALHGQLADTAAFWWPSRDILPPEEVEAARAQMDPKDFREQFEASFEDPAGLIFHAFSREYNVRPCLYRPELPICVGCDFNVDPMAWVLAHIVDDRMEIFDEIWLRNAYTQQALDVLYQRYSNHRSGWQFYGDATSRNRHTSATKSDYLTIYADARFKAMGRSVHFPTVNPGIADRFAACNALLCDGHGHRRCFIDPRCRHLIEDLETRYYKPGTRMPADGPMQGHITDAWGYMVCRLFPLRYRVSDGKREVMIKVG